MSSYSISTIIPVFNCEQYLAEAISSVVHQTLPTSELIVVDDGSTDRSRELAKGFRQVTLLCQSNRGTGSARNAGVRASTGGLLAFLDADDVWEPTKLRVEYEHLVAHPGLDAVFLHAVEFSAKRGQTSRPGVAATVPGAMLIRRAAFERIGFFDETLGAVEAADWWLRALENRLRFEVLPDALYRRRIHDNNRGVLNTDRRAYLRAIKASLDRRRLSGATS